MELLLEARTLLLMGHFYSCVAMCDVVGARLVKEFCGSLPGLERGWRAATAGRCTGSSGASRGEWYARFLEKAELLDAKAAKGCC